MQHLADFKVKTEQVDAAVILHRLVFGLNLGWETGYAD
jgi:hypothetical protein